MLRTNYSPSPTKCLDHASPRYLVRQPSFVTFVSCYYIVCGIINIQSTIFSFIIVIISFVSIMRFYMSNIYTTPLAILQKYQCMCISKSHYKNPQECIKINNDYALTFWPSYSLTLLLLESNSALQR